VGNIKTVRTISVRNVKTVRTMSVRNIKTVRTISVGKIKTVRTISGGSISTITNFSKKYLHMLSVLPWGAAIFRACGRSSIGMSVLLASIKALDTYGHVWDVPVPYGMFPSVEMIPGQNSSVSRNIPGHRSYSSETFQDKHYS
jgi:hypothetical protein